MADSIPSRFITTSDSESNSLAPINFPLRQYISPRQMLAVAVDQIEQGIRSFASPPKVRVIKIKTIDCQSLLYQQVETANAKEFYTVGLEYTGKYSCVTSALRIRDLGLVASVALETKEVTSPRRNFLPWFFGTFFSGNPRKDDLGNERKEPSWGQIVGWWSALLIGGACGVAVGGSVGAVVGAIMFVVPPVCIGSSLNTRRKREVEELTIVAKDSISRAYDQIDIPTILATLSSSGSASNIAQSGSSSTARSLRNAGATPAANRNGGQQPARRN